MQDDPIVNRLKLRDLRILLAVTQSGSMAKAATRLAISQPAISRAISEMEAMLGISLLDRSSQGVEPTPYGRALLKRSAIVFNELSQGVKEIQYIADPTAGEVRIGATSSPTVSIVAAVAERLSLQHPRIRFHVITAEPVMLFRELRERNVDIILARMFAPAVEEDFDFEILYEDRMVAVVAATNPWARRRKLVLAELANEPWTLVPLDTLLGRDVVAAFREKGLEVPRATVETASVHLRNTLLASGRFLTMLYESLLKLPANHPSLKALPVDLATRLRPTAIMTLKKRTLSPAAQLFIECAREVAKSMAAGTSSRGRGIVGRVE